MDSVSNSGEQVDIGAGITNPGPPSDGEQYEPGESAPVIPNPDPNPCDSVGTCGGYIVVMPPDVTAADLASFRPARPSLAGEPAGFGIVGAPTNVVAAASEQYLTGQPARLGRHRAVRAGRLHLRVRRRVDGTIDHGWHELGGARPGAVHADRDESRVPRARDVPGERDRRSTRHPSISARARGARSRDSSPRRRAGTTSASSRPGRPWSTRRASRTRAAPAAERRADVAATVAG